MPELASKDPNIVPESAPQNASKKHNNGIYRFVPDWIIDNAPQITNAGLFVGTGTMLHSGYRGKIISGDLFDAQKKAIASAPGVTAERAAEITAHNIKTRAMIAPGWHKMRLFYLCTAMVSFAIGAIFPRKEDSPEEKERISKMSLGEYMMTRTQHALDPVNHSRQTVGVLSGASGVLGVLSALSQPGGVHKSEFAVSTTLAVGGALLAYINDAKTAQNAFSTLWMVRAPFIVTGTKESMKSIPSATNPLIHEFKQTEAFQKGAMKAYTEGFDGKDITGLFKKKVYGADAIKAYETGYERIKLPYERKDIAYPVGQWTNFASAIVGYFGKGASKQKEAKAEAGAVAETVAAQPASVATNTPAKMLGQNADVAADVNNQPAATVSAPADLARLQASNDAEIAPKQAAIA